MTDDNGTTRKKRPPYGAEHAANEIEHADGPDGVQNGERYVVADALLSESGGLWADQDGRNMHVVDQALGSGEAALRLVRQAFGDEVEVSWFWNSCQGHYAEVASEADGMIRQGHASGRTLALSIVAAAMRYRIAEPVPAASIPPPRNVSLRVVSSTGR